MPILNDTRANNNTDDSKSPTAELFANEALRASPRVRGLFRPYSPNLFRSYSPNLLRSDSPTIQYINKTKDDEIREACEVALNDIVRKIVLS